MKIFRRKSTGEWMNDIQFNDTTAERIAAQFGGTADDYEGFPVKRELWPAALGAHLPAISYSDGEWAFPQRTDIGDYLEIAVHDCGCDENVEDRPGAGHCPVDCAGEYDIIIEKKNGMTGEVVTDGDQIIVIPDSPIVSDVPLPTQLVGGRAEFCWTPDPAKQGMVVIRVESLTAGVRAAERSVLCQRKA